MTNYDHIYRLWFKAQDYAAVVREHVLSTSAVVLSLIAPKAASLQLGPLDSHSIQSVAVNQKFTMPSLFTLKPSGLASPCTELCLGPLESHFITDVIAVKSAVPSSPPVASRLDRRCVVAGLIAGGVYLCYRYRSGLWSTACAIYYAAVAPTPVLNAGHDPRSDTSGPITATSYARLAFPQWAGATSRTLSVFYRVALGRPGVYCTFNVPDLVRSDDDVTVSRVTDGIHFHSNRGAPQFIRCGPPMSPGESRVTLGFLCRHVTSDNVPIAGQYSDHVSTLFFHPGTLHFESAPCRMLPRLFEPSVDSETYGHVSIIHGRTHVSLAWPGTVPVSVPNHVYYDALNRHDLNSTTTKFASLSIALKNYPDVLSPMMHALTNGLTFDASASSRVGNLEIGVDGCHNNIPDGYARLMLLHPPILSDALVVPANGPNAIVNAVHKRLFEPPKHVAMSPEIAAHAVAFAQMVFPDDDSLVALDPAEVYAAMKRPVQRAEALRLDSVWDLATTQASLFAKSEPVKGDAAVRLIAAFQGPFNPDTARYTLPLSEWMSKFKCWGPSKKNQDIQSLVRELHASVFEKFDEALPVSGDFSKYDATTGPIGRDLLFIVLLCGFRLSPHAARDIRKALAFLDDPVARSSAGPISLGYGTKSGSADTTLRNTLLNMFLLFVAHVRAGLSRTDAFSAVVETSLVYGDDSLTAPIPTQVAVASEFGLKLVIEPSPHGHCTFLGRLYPTPRFSGDCIASMSRFLGKFHIIEVPAGCTPERAVSQRAMGHLVNDPMTPLLSTFSRAILARYPCAAIDGSFHDAYHHQRLTESGAYQVQDHSYPELLYHIGLDTGLPPEYLEALDFAMSRPYSIGKVYPIASYFCVAEFPGLIMDGVPAGPPAEPLSTRVVAEVKKRADKASALSRANALAAIELGRLQARENLTSPDNTAPPAPTAAGVGVIDSAPPSSSSLALSSDSGSEFGEVMADMGFSEPPLPSIRPLGRRCGRCREFGHVARQCPNTEHARRKRKDRNK